MVRLKLFIFSSLLLTASAFAHGPKPVPLTNVPVPPVPGLTDGEDPIVVDKTSAIILGKALFWDTALGSDGQACASCHFHAGADRRIKNQVNPGQKSPQPTGQTFQALPDGTMSGPNNTLHLSDFPLYQYQNPLDPATPVTFSTDDVVGSQGTFGGIFKSASRTSGVNDNCSRGQDPVFHVNAVGTRRVEPRNSPTVINAVFNYRNFWDGRANNIFNGSSNWGPRDPSAGVWIADSATYKTVSKQALNLINSSLASQAVAPPQNDVEMTCDQRSWPDIGRKLLGRKPLQYQAVHYQDSVLGALSHSDANHQRPGLKTTYQKLVEQAFNKKYWAYAGKAGVFGTPEKASAAQLSTNPSLYARPYTQIEANFSMFFGLALQLYESTLISDQSPFDLSPRQTTKPGQSDYLVPTWANISDPALVSQLQRGFTVFFGEHCGFCHAGPNLSSAAVAVDAALLTPPANGATQTYGPKAYPISYGPYALGGVNSNAVAGITQYGNVINRDLTISNVAGAFMDLGFFNTGVADPQGDPGVAGLDAFNNPLSFSVQYVNYLTCADKSTAAKLLACGVYDAPVAAVRACDFSTSLSDNTSNTESPNLFTTADAIIQDPSTPDPTTCALPNTAYIPTAAAAQAALNQLKMSQVTQAAFKIPSLRNVELTGPYMHNGSMATLDQVLEFYARTGNFLNADQEQFMPPLSALASTSTGANDRLAVVALLKSFTDDRVRYEQAPFDHPAINIPHGNAGNETAAVKGNPLDSKALAKDEYLAIEAVGANGVNLETQRPAQPFDTYLQP